MILLHLKENTSQSGSAAQSFRNVSPGVWLYGKSQIHTHNTGRPPRVPDELPLLDTIAEENAEVIAKLREQARGIGLISNLEEPEVRPPESSES